MPAIDQSDTGAGAASVQAAPSEATAGRGTRAPFWAGGVKFDCKAGCGACCRAPGEVYFSADDIRRAAALLNIDDAEFIRRYLRVHNEHLHKLTVGVNSACSFLDGHRCTIHAAKPTQCATFPFWPEHLKSRGAYNRLGQSCPGVAEGETLVPASKVKAQLDRHRENGLPE